MHSTPADVAVAPSYHAANSTEWLHSCTAACVMHGAGRARLTAAAEAGVGRDRAHEAPLVRCPVARHRLVQVALKRQDAVLLRLLRRRGKEGARTSKPRWATLWQASSGQLPDKRAASSLHAQSLAGCMHAVGLLCTCPPPRRTWMAVRIVISWICARYSSTVALSPANTSATCGASSSIATSCCSLRVHKVQLSTCVFTIPGGSSCG